MPRAIYFDGVTNRRLTSSKTISLLNGLTIFAAVRINNTTASSKTLAIVASNSGTGADARLYLGSYGTANNFTCRIISGWPNFIGRYGVLPAGFGILACSYDKGATTAAGIKMWWNGVRVDTGNDNNGSFSIPGTNGANVINLGAYGNGTTSLTMSLSDYLLFEQGLTEAQVLEISSTLMNRHSISGAPSGSTFHKDPTTYPGLSVYLRAEHNTLAPSLSTRIASLTDLSGNGNNFSSISTNYLHVTRDDQAENLIRYSRDITQSSVWTTSNASVPASNALTENAVTSTHYIFAVGAGRPVAAGLYRATIRVKPNGRTWIYLLMENSDSSRAGYFNIEGNGAFGTMVSDFPSKSIERNQDGSYTISVTANYSTETANPILNIYLASADGTNSYLGDITKGIYIYDAVLHRETVSALSSATGSETQIAAPSLPNENLLAGSNIQIGYNQIPLRSVSTSTSSESASYPHTNLFLGSSAIFYQRATSGTETTFDFNLPQDVTDEVNYLYLRGIKESSTAAGGFGVEVRAREFDNNFAAGYQVVLDAGMQGPNCGLFLEDWIGKVFSGQQYRFFRVVIKTPTSTLLTIRKMLLGKLFVLPRSPSYPYERIFAEDNSTFISDSGSKFISSKGRRSRAYKFNWKYITNSERDSFEYSIGYYLKDFPIVLVERNSAGHKALDNVASFGVANYSIESPVWKDRHNLTLAFAEDTIG